MRLLQIIIKTRHPNTIFLCSSANEEYTDGNIETMGINLAKEVNANLQEKENNIIKYIPFNLIILKIF